MYLTVTSAGTPVWRVKYRFNGSERLFAVGSYPEFSLERARAERDKVKSLLRQGRDPVQSRRLDRATEITASGETFRAVAVAWLEKQKGQWSDIHYTKSRRALERDVLNRIGDLPIKDITSQMVAGVIETILKRGVRETAMKILQHINGIFRLAQVRGLRDNPADAISEILPAKNPTRPMPALLTWPALGDILRRADAASVSRPVRMAHRLCAFSLARISNVVGAEWAEFVLDGDVPIWTIPRAKMKSKDKRHAHKIILAPTIAADLRGWRSIVGEDGFVFPSLQGGKHISRESIEKVYRVTLGLADRHTPQVCHFALNSIPVDFTDKLVR
jgi:integrase